MLCFHDVDDFRKYVEEHQTDFIEFKTKVMLQGVTDPIKRSEAINSIVKSVSMITDQIVRATYIKECSSRLGISEQILITTMNNFIRNYRDEQRKEEERNNRALQRGRTQPTQGQSQPATPQPNAGQNTAQSASATQQPSSNDPYGDYPPDDAFLPPEAFSESAQQGSAPQQPEQTYQQGGYQSSAYVQSAAPSQSPGAGRGGFVPGGDLSVQELLIRFVIRYGEQIVIENVEAGDGQLISLTVAELTQIDLGNDNLTFDNPLHTQILAEAVAHSKEEGFKAERYFISHAEYELSQYAIKLTEDPIQLTKSYQMSYDSDRLKAQLDHLLLDVRFEYVENKISYVRQEMGICSNDKEKYMDLIAELQRFQKMRTAIAKKLGRS